jgi:hypothetical protein
MRGSRDITSQVMVGILLSPLAFPHAKTICTEIFLSRSFRRKPAFRGQGTRQCYSTILDD